MQHMHINKKQKGQTAFNHQSTSVKKQIQGGSQIKSQSRSSLSSNHIICSHKSTRQLSPCTQHWGKTSHFALFWGLHRIFQNITAAATESSSQTDPAERGRDGGTPADRHTPSYW